MLPSPAGREASSGGSAPSYVRHRPPERTLLYQLVEEYYPAFKAYLAARGNVLRGYVEQEFEDYLKCGRLEHGFLRVRCDTCHAEHLVAFSCKKRGFCPSCGARRMAESAALLADEVFHEQPVRQWVLSVPYPLRFLFASRPEVMGQARHSLPLHRYALDPEGRLFPQDGPSRRGHADPALRQCAHKIAGSDFGQPKGVEGRMPGITSTSTSTCCSSTGCISSTLKVRCASAG